MSTSRVKGLRWTAGNNTPDKVYITRVFNYGTWNEWCDLKKNYSKKSIKSALENPLRGQWTRRGRLLAEKIYGLKIPDHALIVYG